MASEKMTTIKHTSDGVPMYGGEPELLPFTLPSKIVSRRPWQQSRPRRPHYVKQGGSRCRSSLDGTSTHHGLTNEEPAVRKEQELEKGPSNASAVVVLTR